MGSPDPYGRQIDGLGGGISSLSKVAILGSPQEYNQEFTWDHLNPTPSFLSKVEQRRWGSERSKPDENVDNPDIPDVIYKFGQVQVKTPEIDWSTTCGNLVAAVAQETIDSRIISIETIVRRIRKYGNVVPVHILSWNTGARMVAHVPVALPKENFAHDEGDVTELSEDWRPAWEGDASISGVPGTAAPINIEFLDGLSLPTGRALDDLVLDDGCKVSKKKLWFIRQLSVYG
jgi:2-methylaconitate cis-trans-isomerase PrpF